MLPSPGTMQMPRGGGGGERMLKLRFDRYIRLTFIPGFSFILFYFIFFLAGDLGTVEYVAIGVSLGLTIFIVTFIVYFLWRARNRSSMDMTKEMGKVSVIKNGSS